MRAVPDIAAAEISRLEKRGIAVTNDDVVWLSCLGYRVENPNSQTLEASNICEGVMLSNGIMLKELTVRATEWLNRFGVIFPDKADYFIIAYAMANPKNLHLDDAVKKVVLDVSKWVSVLNVSASEIETAVARLLADDAPENPKSEKMTTPEMVGLLVAATGLKAEYWHAQTWDMIDKTHDGIIKYASLMSDVAESPESQLSKIALKDLALAVQEIAERDKEAKNG